MLVPPAVLWPRRTFAMGALRLQRHAAFIRLSTGDPTRAATHTPTGRVSGLGRQTSSTAGAGIRPTITAQSLVGLHKIFVYVESFMHESVVLSPPPPTCISHTVAILLHDYWALYRTSSNPLLYAIHHTRLVITISCKG